MTTRRSWILLLGGLAIVTALIGWGVNRQLIDRNIEFASERLMLLNNLRRQALERYFETAEAELRFWSDRQDLIEHQQWLNAAWTRAVEADRDPERVLKFVYVDNNPYPQGERRKLTEPVEELREQFVQSRYVTLHAELHPLARKFVEERAYYDFFLISPVGNVHYTVEKEDDFGTNLHTGPYKDSGLAEAFRRALVHAQSDDVAISDMAAYAPSAGDPAMFMAKAMYGERGELVGVIALQLPTDRIVEIMNFRGGMGATGETYVVGDDLLMRSNSRFSEQSTILSQTVDTATARRGLRGEYGVEFTEDYRGATVLSAFSSATIDDHSWAVLAEIDRAEILQQATSERPLLAGLMLFFYSLALWSVWFVGRAAGDMDGASMLGDMDLDGGVDVGEG